MNNGWLLVGIAQAETGLAHCWSEATWACEGPASSDCSGGGVIAGSADGPCADQQGGLGMFQFDAGDYDDTLAREGSRILSIDGSVEAAIEFVSAMVVRSTFVSGVDTADQAVEWMNGVSIGGERWDAWVSTVVRYYNGCSTTSSCWSGRYASYRDKTVAVYNEMGASFWDVGVAPDDAGVSSVDAGGTSDGGAPDAGTPDAGTTGDSTLYYVAGYDGTTFPPQLVLPPGASWRGAAYFANLGTAPWEVGRVELATLPRVESLLGDDTWVEATVAATVDHETPTGDGASFIFAVHAPEYEGTYRQQFQLLVDDAPLGGAVAVAFAVDVQVVEGATPPDEVDLTGETPTEGFAPAGCAAVDPSGGTLLLLGLLGLRRRRTR